MKRTLFVVSSMAILTLGGCTSVSPNGTSAFEIDQAQVAAVEAAARQYGVQVYWLNYPRKKTDR